MFKGDQGSGGAQCPNCGAPWEPTTTGACRFCEQVPMVGPPQAAPYGQVPPYGQAPPTVPTGQPMQYIHVPTPGPIVDTRTGRGCGWFTVLIIVVVVLPLIATAAIFWYVARETSNGLSGFGSAFTTPSFSVPNVTVPNLGALNGSGSVSGAMAGSFSGIVSATGGDPLSCRTSVGRVTGVVFTGSAPSPPGGSLSIVATLPAGLRGPGTYGTDQGLTVDVALTGGSTQLWKAGPGNAATLTVAPTGDVSLRFEGLPSAASTPGSDPLLAQPLSGTLTLTCPG
ncbi:MAG: hypothetical protein U0Q07_13950 [Acidimicrobiales bacterium]